MPSHTLTPAKRITRGVCLADPLWPLLGDAERRVVIAWETIAVRLMGATDKTRELQCIRRDFAGILRGLSKGTIYRKVAALSDLGAEGVLGAAALRRLGQKDGSRLPKAFILYWRHLCAENQRMKALNVWQMLMRNLKGGVIIPGYDMDWRGIWLSEHPGRILPNTEECTVYAVDHRRNAHPRGWSYRNLKSLAPEEDVWKAAAQGVAAGRAYLLSPPHTRAGLKRGQIVEIDDMWHDVKVRYGNAPAERCIELAMLDVATGYRAYLLKPIRRREDGTRETVMARMMPYLLGHWLIVQGYCPAGALICGEHNTAALSKPLAAAIEAATGGKVTFRAGGKLSKPLAQGLWEGKPRGNFRFKARLEGSHSLLHNELGAVPGQVGHTHANAPEALYAMDKAEAELHRACAKLAKADPDLPNRLRWPYIPYADYAALVAEAVGRINARTDHALEGWEAQGFVTGSFRLGPREPWRDLADLDTLPQGMREAILAQLRADPSLTRTRRLSPAEAWEKRAGDVIRADRCFMPRILGDALAMPATCSDKLELKVKDPAIDLTATVAGIVTDSFGAETLLERGRPYRVWINPLEPTLAYVAEALPDGDTRYLGTAPVLLPTHQDDPEGVTANLKLRAKAQALERAALLPIAQARAAQKQAIDAHNEALVAAAKARLEAPRQPPRKPPAKVLRSASMDDLI